MAALIGRLRGGAPFTVLLALGTAWVAACSVYRPSDLESVAVAGSTAAPQGGEPASAGSASQGGSGAGPSSGGMAPVGATGGGGSASASGGSGGSSPAGGSSNTSGMANAGGEGGTDPVPDECPADDGKVAPGACGCGIPENCQSLQAALVHRYDFEGSGTTVTDRVGDKHGTIIGATLSQLEGRGVVNLTGGPSGPYVDLPNGLISSLTSVTVESWVTWRGGAVWQRIFDFGDTTATNPENTPASGKTYLFATPKSENDVALASYSHDGNADGQQLEATASAALPLTLSQVVVVANGAAHRLSLYINGEKVSEQGWTGSLEQINDVNVWLGRSQYTQDQELNGVFHDFRLYDAALTDAQVTTAYLGGPDPQFFAGSDASSVWWPPSAE